MKENVRTLYRKEIEEATPQQIFQAVSYAVKEAIVDDWLATGGTSEAAIKLVEELGGEVVKVVFLMELAGLKGRERFKGYEVESVLCYDGK